MEPVPFFAVFPQHFFLYIPLIYYFPVFISPSPGHGIPSSQSFFKGKIFWDVMPSRVVGYQCFRGLSCLHLQGEVTGMGRSGIDTGLD
jgi:hypothetical protein